MKTFPSAQSAQSALLATSSDRHRQLQPSPPCLSLPQSPAVLALNIGGLGEGLLGCMEAIILTHSWV